MDAAFDSASFQNDAFQVAAAIVVLLDVFIPMVLASGGALAASSLGSGGAFAGSSLGTGGGFAVTSVASGGSFAVATTGQGGSFQ